MEQSFERVLSDEWLEASGLIQSSDAGKYVRVEKTTRKEELDILDDALRLLHSLVHRAYLIDLDWRALVELIVGALETLHFELGYSLDKEAMHELYGIGLRLRQEETLEHPLVRNDMGTMAVGSDRLPSHKSRQNRTLWMRRPDRRISPIELADHILGMYRTNASTRS